MDNPIEKEILNFIKENNLSPFNKYKSELNSSYSIFKTRDAKSIHNKVLSKISSNFCFSETSNIFSFFEFTQKQDILKLRQDFHKKLPLEFNFDFLSKITIPKQNWKPKYDVIVVTQNEKTYSQLKELNCPVELLLSQHDLSSLESCDIVQVIDCEELSSILETLPQSVFLDEIEEAYLERYLEKLSGWRENLEILSSINLPLEIQGLVDNLKQLINLINNKESAKLTRDQVLQKIDEINNNIFTKIKEINISGQSVFEILSKNKLPPEFRSILDESIKNSSLPQNILNISIPITLDEQELENLIKKQNAQEFTSIAEKIKSHSLEIQSIPEKLDKLSNYILYLDFISGIKKFNKENSNFPEISNELSIYNSKNIFLENAQPISFNLNHNQRCSILTGANSGGKTTLLEHIIQLISLFQLGFPSSGKITLPIFTDIYYFAKNKGSTNKGAFETLLNQMSKIEIGANTLILADEIESVTEPGVAGNIISATVNYFTQKNCFLVIATHLGQEIQKNPPLFSRIDGIEAKGLDNNFDLIVDHNPVLGRLANSTPELIVEKLASSEKLEYYIYLHTFLKNNKR